ncbi:hypothetical protein G1K53_11480 [Tenacibaculum finnmarkense]|uniref:hypothetical protein n=1 Tax=Tenacibaculum finnmarkense TaxID=2781243 RepID=UPI001EFBF4DA|nr:hypothetical protein [Tenacibaculum finnmarkense]MCG8208130.1 hypothetical protein [Tenacibaculum finnmarkense genomovar finnmarkense]MCG8742458.1 hypothetical protein [Tenacibaculum finnmarkense]MCG8765861.1 hypothetical protein [Tenacibaculum finnmarkense]MCM8907266.1 hypothetical protein [Tenacibaculum finnmarkense genomovar finnmarkense]
MSRKVKTTHLQIKSVKNASSLGTDEDGNVITGVKSDEKEIDLSMYRKKRGVIFINQSDIDSNGVYSLFNANLEDTILVVQGKLKLSRILFNTNSIKSVGSTIEIVNTVFPIDVVFDDSKAMNYQDENSKNIARGKTLKVTKIGFKNMQDYILH